MIFNYLVLALLLCSQSLCATGPNEQDLAHPLDHTGPTYDEKATILSSLPFRDAILSRSPLQDDDFYLQCIEQRPELRSINWNHEDPVQIAEQIWCLRSSKPDCLFHRELTKACKVIMKSMAIENEKIKTVLAIIADWTRVRRKKARMPKHLSQAEIEERKEQERLRNNEITRKRREARRSGLNMPLIHYIELAGMKNVTPQRLHEEALKYQYLYPSARAFISSLHQLWNRLGIDERQVYHLNRDTRNKDFYKNTETRVISEEESIPYDGEAITVDDANTLALDSTHDGDISPPRGAIDTSEGAITPLLMNPFDMQDMRLQSYQGFQETYPQELDTIPYTDFDDGSYIEYDPSLDSSDLYHGSSGLWDP